MLCPVDLAVCERAGCRGGQCELADTAPLAVCWECGTIEAQGIVAGVCIACIAEFHHAREATER